MTLGRVALPDGREAAGAGTRARTRTSRGSHHPLTSSFPFDLVIAPHNEPTYAFFAASLNVLIIRDKPTTQRRPTSKLLDSR